MCRLSLKLLLHLNSKFTGLNGYAAPGTSNGTSETSDAERHSYQKKDVQQTATARSPALVTQLLYATSGCLQNIARHPRNHFTLFGVELEVKTRRAAEDLLASGASPRASLDVAHSAGAVTTMRIGVGTKVETDREGSSMKPPAVVLKGDHVKGLANVRIPNVDLSVTQKEASVKHEVLDVACDGNHMLPPLQGLLGFSPYTETYRMLPLFCSFCIPFFQPPSCHPGMGREASRMAPWHTVPATMTLLGPHLRPTLHILYHPSGSIFNSQGQMPN